MPQASPGKAGEPRRRDGVKRRAAKPGTRLHEVGTPKRRRGIRIRIKKPDLLRNGVRLRIAKPVVSTPQALAWARRADVALLMAPGELSLAVLPAGARSNSQKRFSARLPRQSIRSALQAGNLREPDVVVFTLKRMWHEAHLRPRRVRSVTLIIPDQCVRMVALPLEGGKPRPAEGDSMARWALSESLPGEIEAYRIDWAILPGDDSSQTNGWLFALAAETALVREYERPVERLGLSVGRILPVTIAVAASTARKAGGDPAHARLVLCGTGRRPAALLEADGIPRIHRAWRRPDVSMEAELRSIDAYARRRLGLTIAEALVVGPPRWVARVTGVCRDMGWPTTSKSRWCAHRIASV